MGTAKDFSKKWLLGKFVYELTFNMFNNICLVCTSIQDIRIILPLKIIFGVFPSLFNFNSFI
jgi:hypothetical protein